MGFTHRTCKLVLQNGHLDIRRHSGIYTSRSDFVNALASHAGLLCKMSWTDFRRRVYWSLETAANQRNYGKPPRFQGVHVFLCVSLTSQNGV